MISERRESSGRRDEGAVAAVERALLGLRYGEVVVNVHEGRVVQITRIEKVRLGAGDEDVRPASKTK